MGRSWTLVLVLVLVLAALGFGTAHGNGRPPITNSIHFRPGDAHSIYLGTTFGLLISHDDGCTFQYFCETDVGYGGIYDPSYAVAADGAIFATTYTGLRVSRDDGCTFTTATDQLPMGDPNRIDAVIGALDIGPSGEVWIGTADTSRASNALWKSADNGATFAPTAQSSATYLYNSVMIAPGNAMRVYATAIVPPGASAASAHVLYSQDGGTTWMESALAGVTFSPVPIMRVAAIDASNPDVVYVVSTNGANAPNGDFLYRSSDGGKTFAKVGATTDQIRDVVIVDATHVIAACVAGSLISSDGGMTFSAMAQTTPQLSCLGDHAGALLGCGTNWDPDFMAVARSADVGTSWSKVWRFINIDGPGACAAGTVEHDTCAAMNWPVIKQQFGATGPACGMNMWPADTAMPGHPGGGCCEAGGGAATSLGWAGVFALWLVRRRRPAHDS
jgi:uncharacterized protein (TIGR03382 family)